MIEKVARKKNKSSERPIWWKNPSQTKKELLKSKRIDLEKLCNELDPYAPLSREVRDKLFFLGIVDYKDPFKVTNELLLILEELEKKQTH